MTRSINEGLCSAPTFTPHRVKVVAVDDVDKAATRASLDLATKAAGNLDTIVEARTAGSAGNSITVAAVGDRTDGTEVITEVGTAVTIHYDDDVSTVAEVETAIGAQSALIRVKTAGTGATVLDAATDDFTAAALAAGDDGLAMGWGCDSSDWDEVIAQIKVDGSSATVAVLFWSDLVGNFIPASTPIQWTGLAASTQVRFSTGGQRFFMHCSGTFTRIDIDVAGAAPE